MLEWGKSGNSDEYPTTNSLDEIAACGRGMPKERRAF